MPILDIQKRARELGRIRIGQTIPITKRNGDPGTRPEKLDRFRLTSASKPLLDRVAELYGGEVREWQPQGGGAKAWEVITDTNRIPVLVPPTPVSQYMEQWTGGTCKRRCDSVTELLSDQPCICKVNEAELCKPTTRLNVILRDVEGIGVWRLETHGWNAAIELPDSAAFLAQAGGYVEGFLSLEERTSKAEVVKNGETKTETRHFMVPTIEISVTPAQLLAGGGRVAAPSVEGPVAQKAIEASGTEEVVLPTLDDINGATSQEVLRSIFRFLSEHDALTDELRSACTDRAAVLSAAETSTGDGDGDADGIWQQILATAGGLAVPMTLEQVQADFATRYGMAASVASAAELQVYLDELKGAVPA